jgi:hypothetical protein
MPSQQIEVLHPTLFLLTLMPPQTLMILLLLMLILALAL